MTIRREYAISDFSQQFDDDRQDAADGQTDGEATDESLTGERVGSEPGHDSLVGACRRLEDVLAHVVQ